MHRDVSMAPGGRSAAPERWSESDHATAYDQLLRGAITALTAAARLTRTERWPDGTGSNRPCDWAEFVALALAGAAANVGGIETVLAGRPGSWEADAVRRLLTATVGHDEQQLLTHRTDSVVVSINVDDMMVDLGAWQAYDDACDALQRRYDDLGLSDVRSTSGCARGCPGRVGGSHPRAGTRVRADRRAAGPARATAPPGLGRLRRSARDPHPGAGLRIKGLRVPVVVHVDVDLVPTAGPPGTWGSGVGESIPERLLHAAVRATPLPGRGRTPLERLEQDG